MLNGTVRDIQDRCTSFASQETPLKQLCSETRMPTPSTLAAWTFCRQCVGTDKPRPTTSACCLIRVAIELRLRPGMLEKRHAHSAVLCAPTGAIHTQSVDAGPMFCKGKAQDHTLGSAWPNRDERTAWRKQNSFPRFCRPLAVGGQVKAPYCHTDHTYLLA